MDINNLHLRLTPMGANPVKYVYDLYGRPVEQYQFRDEISGSTYNDVGKAFSKVSWEYAPISGVLRSKSHYNNTTPQKETYYYNHLGQPKTRILARIASGSTPVTSTFAYSSGSATGTGDLLTVTHNDSTPGESYSYDRMGRLKNVTDHAGQRVFTYGSLNGLGLSLENLSDGFYGSGKDFSYSYETSGVAKVPGRFASFSYGGTTWSQSYHAADGRLHNATASGTGFPTSLSFAHNYAPGSDHLSVAQHGSYKQERVWDSWRESLSHSKTHWHAGGLSAHYVALTRSTQHEVTQYQLYDDAITESLAKKIRGTGTGALVYTMTYDQLGQLKTWDTNRTTGVESSYAWDQAGNPTNYAGTTLTPNSLNQLNQFGYDLDGNLTSDGTWTYQYDANNRLWRMHKTSGGAQSLEFKYDYMGRRVEKKVWNTSTYSGALASHLKFAYRGMELVAELSSTGAVRKTFHWGLDKSDTRNGAGGAMGLLMWRDHVAGQSYFPAYDLNGNVTGLLNASGAYVAWYEYDGFGRVLTKGGTDITVGGATFDAEAYNPIRYSTQYTDEETGLVYYGFRYYDPSKGRFLNRDPIGEAGGLNLYKFVGNNPVTNVDRWGLDPYHLPGLEVKASDCYTYTSVVYDNGFIVSLKMYKCPDNDPVMLGAEVIGKTFEEGPGGVYEDVRSGGGGGNGPSNPPPPPAPKEDPDEKKKNDCEKFVDDIVRLAESNESWTKGPDFFQGLHTGADLVDSFVPSSGPWYNLNNVTRGTLGNIPGTGVPYIGLSGFDGFKQSLTGNGQGTDVGRHVAAAAALTLQYDNFWAVPLANWFDGRQNPPEHSPAEEIAGNLAGEQVGFALRDFHGDKIGSGALKSRLLDQLCGD